MTREGTEMRRRSFLCLPPAVLLRPKTAPAMKAKRPNVLLIVSDDQPAQMLSCYRNERVSGDRRFSITPALDAVAATGTRFRNAYCQFPVCSPARATILTGRYPDSHGVLNNKAALSLEELTLQEVLRRNGYFTAAVGKAPLGEDPRNYYSAAQGFDETYGAGKDTALIRMPKGPAGSLGANSWGHFLGKQEDHRDYRATRQAIDIIRRCTQQDRPFFVWLAYHATHNVIAPPPPFDTRFEDLAKTIPLPPPDTLEGKPARQRKAKVTQWAEQHWRTFWAKKAGDSAAMDSLIGTLVGELDALGIRQDTLIVFTADQGSYTGEHGLIGKVVDTYYEPYVKCPLMVSWPGLVPEGKVVDGLGEHADLMPTILELLKIGTPETVQGRSLRPLIEQGTPVREYVHSRFMRSRMVFDGRYKMVREAGGPNVEVYDLHNDADELRNLAGRPEYEEVSKRLAAEIEEHKRRFSAPSIEAEGGSA